MGNHVSRTCQGHHLMNFQFLWLLTKDLHNIMAVISYEDTVI